MNLQQFRYVSEVARRGLNVSDAAEALHTSQPGVSKQIRALEEELGTEIFVRQGRRFTAITDAGREIVAALDRILAEVANLKAVGEEFAHHAKGNLAVAVTHTQARYALPAVVTAFKKSFPDVKLKLLQGNPHQLARMVVAGEADLAIATEALMEYPELVTLPCYQWNRCVLVPRGHPLAKSGKLTLAALARYPIVTYDYAFTGRSQINAAFDAEGLVPNVVLTALDSDVIKTYVELGMGVGIVARMAYDPERDTAFEMLDAGHLFASSITRIAIRRGAFLRGYIYDFIQLFAPALDRSAVDTALAGAEKPGARLA